MRFNKPGVPGPANFSNFDFNVAYSSRGGYSLIKTLKLKKLNCVSFDFNVSYSSSPYSSSGRRERPASMQDEGDT